MALLQAYSAFDDNFLENTHNPYMWWDIMVLLDKAMQQQ